MSLKLSIFIGSSTEGLQVANTIAEYLADVADCKVWKDVFDANKSYYEDLTSKIALYDFAILVATRDDVLKSREALFDAARDNVIFEFGLFAGGLGANRSFYLVEEGVKIFSDLSGISLPAFKRNDNLSIMRCAAEVKKQIAQKGDTFDLGFIPSTALAYGYFTNFVERTVERLLEDRIEGKTFHLETGTDFKIVELKFTILIPDDLSDDMFRKVKNKRLKDGWQKLKVDPKDVRDYDFSVDVTRAAQGEMHLVDIPLTLNALNKSILMYVKKSYVGKDETQKLLEAREIRNFKRTLDYLVEHSALTRGIVDVSVVDI